MGNKLCAVEREDKHRLGQLLALIGFLMVPLGGLGYSFFTLDSSLGAGSAVMGFLLFLAGAELALRNHMPDDSDR